MTLKFYDEEFRYVGYQQLRAAASQGGILYGVQTTSSCENSFLLNKIVMTELLVLVLGNDYLSDQKYHFISQNARFIH